MAAAVTPSNAVAGEVLAAHRRGSGGLPACHSWLAARAAWRRDQIRPATIPNRKSQRPAARAGRPRGSESCHDAHSGHSLCRSNRRSLPRYAARNDPGSHKKAANWIDPCRCRVRKLGDRTNERRRRNPSTCKVRQSLGHRRRILCPYAYGHRSRAGKCAVWCHHHARN